MPSQACFAVSSLSQLKERWHQDYCAAEVASCIDTNPYLQRCLLEVLCSGPSSLIVWSDIGINEPLTLLSDHLHKTQYFSLLMDATFWQ